MLNNNSSVQAIFFICIMMIIAFFLQELPSSNVLQMALPEWPYMLMLYFSVSTRYSFGVLTAFLVGIIQDVFLGIPTLGFHAAIYVIASFIMISSRLRFKYLSVASQSISIGILVFFKVLSLTIYSTVLYTQPTHFWSFLSIPCSILLWPSIHLFFLFLANRHAQH